MTNVELVADADNDDSSLVRFEFLEILVRAGIAKYAKNASCGVASVGGTAADPMKPKLEKKGSKVCATLSF